MPPRGVGYLQIFLLSKYTYFWRRNIQQIVIEISTRSTWINTMGRIVFSCQFPLGFLLRSFFLFFFFIWNFVYTEIFFCNKVKLRWSIKKPRLIIQNFILIFFKDFDSLWSDIPLIKKTIPYIQLQSTYSWRSMQNRIVVLILISQNFFVFVRKTKLYP